MYTDAHNHAHDEWLAPHRERIDAQLSALPLKAAVVNGTSEEDWGEVARFCSERKWAKASYGLHPWDVGNRSERWRAALTRRLDGDPRAGVGEIGLDKWILERAKADDPRLKGLRRAPIDEQIDVFKTQLQLTVDFGRPATIHCIDAWGVLREVLEDARELPRTLLLHAYGGSAELVPVFAKMGAYFSFNGYFLAKGREKRLEVFRTIPSDRLLVETDAPAMPLPAEWRTHKLPRVGSGEQPNHPANIEAAYAGLAAFLGEGKEELAKRVGRNFEQWWDGRAR